MDSLRVERYAYIRGPKLEYAAGWNVPDGDPFLQALRRLVVVLRELHCLNRRVAESVTFDDQPSTDDQAFGHANELAPPLVELAFVYFRRLPDLLARTLAHRIFGAWKSAPLDFKNWIAEPEALLKLNPRCDGEALTRAVLEAAPWFNRLRGRSPEGKRGIRDSLEHRSMRVDVQASKTGDHPTRLQVSITGEASDSVSVFDALVEIRSFTASLAALLTSMTALLPGTGAYDVRCCAMVTGSLDDTTGFWPQL